MKKINKFLCKIFGHVAKCSEVTGFRNCDGAVIARCQRCGLPLVKPGLRATKYLMRDLHEIKKRDEVTVFIKEQLNGETKYYGLCELRELLDYIYGGEPDNDRQKLRR